MTSARPRPTRPRERRRAKLVTVARLATLAGLVGSSFGCNPVPLAPPKEAAVSAPDGTLAAIYGKSERGAEVSIEELQVGNGPSLQMGDVAKVHYVGRLVDGTEFDTSRNRPGSFELTTGKGMVIRGFERGMVGMKVGGVRRIHIPWPLAYGEAGSPPRIPPRADLVFEIELLDIPVPETKAPPPKGAPQGAPPPPQ